MTFTMLHSNRFKVKNFIVKLAVLLFWIGVWQGVFMIVNEKYGDILLVSPLQVLNRLFELVKTADFWIDTFTSLFRITQGYLLGIVFALLIAVLTSRFSFFSYLLKPVISLVKTTPVTSFILLALVWIKKDSVAVFISFLMVLPIIWSNVCQGLEQTDKSLLEMAKVFRFSPFKKLKTIYFHSIMPYFIAGCTTALGFAWKAGIAAEVLSTPLKSIGYNLYRSKINIETADLFAWTAVVIVLSVVFEKIIVAVLSKISVNGEDSNGKNQ